MGGKERKGTRRHMSAKQGTTGTRGTRQHTSSEQGQAGTRRHTSSK